MLAPHGFVVLTHSAPEQLRRLVARLDATFEAPPIVVHHDFGQAPFAPAGFPTNVAIVRDWVPTAWGTLSVVEASLRALRQMAERADAPEWVTLLSGADYPLRRPAAVLADLQGGGADAYVRHVLIDPRRPAAPVAPSPIGCDVAVGPSNYRQCVRRCFRFELRASVPGLGRVTLGRTVHPQLSRWLAPYGPGRRCYAGPSWFTLRRTALHYLLEWHDRNRWLEDHLRERFAPDESYVHTVLCNAPALRVADRNFRYVDWRHGGPHPRTLDESDLPALLASGAHFARKFAPDAPVLDRLDAVLDGPAR